MILVVLEELRFSLRHPRVRMSLWVLVAGLGLLVTTYGVYWWPAWRTTEALRASIAIRRHTLVDADFNNKLAIAAQRASLQIEQIEKRLDASVAQVTLVQQLGALAQRNRVKILSETYEEGKPKDGYTSLVHELTLQADYSTLRGFLLGLQQLPTVTIVQEATLERLPNSTFIKAHVRMVTYSRLSGKS
ncbi:MAG: hypothetical protein HY080_01295 [Gammaproteobacteria bacterium]|nr:hypothetical protein [Gammaproteobacteria bacterium]